MRRSITLSCTLATLLLILALAVGASLGASPMQATQPAQPAPVAEPVTHWPVALQASEGLVEVYQPQPEAMKADVLTARAAVSLTRSGGTGTPVFGAAWFTAHIVTDRDTRTVTLRQVTAQDVRLPGATAAEQQEFARAISGALSAAQVTFPLDQLTASLDTARREQPGNDEWTVRRAGIYLAMGDSSTSPSQLLGVREYRLGG